MRRVVDPLSPNRVVKACTGRPRAARLPQLSAKVDPRVCGSYDGVQCVYDFTVCQSGARSVTSVRVLCPEVCRVCVVKRECVGARVLRAVLELPRGPVAIAIAIACREVLASRSRCGGRSRCCAPFFTAGRNDRDRDRDCRAMGSRARRSTTRTRHTAQALVIGFLRHILLARDCRVPNRVRLHITTAVFYAHHGSSAPAEPRAAAQAGAAASVRH